MKKCSLEEILGKRIQDPYEVQYQYVMDLLSSGQIKTVKSSPGNGKKPALHTQYWLIEENRKYQGAFLYDVQPESFECGTVGSACRTKTSGSFRKGRGNVKSIGNIWNVVQK